MNFEEWHATQDKNVFRSGEEHMRLAYSAGAKQMRERAAQSCNDSAESVERTGFERHARVLQAQAQAIRALPIGESSQAPQEKP